MNSNLRSKLRLIFLCLMVVLAGCKKRDDHSDHGGDQYTCPMHPQIIQDKPGTCPVCGMDLVMKGRPGEEIKITKELSNLLKPTNAAIVSSIRTVRPVGRSVGFKTEVKGVITYDTRKATTLPVRIGGRIEKLFVRYNFQPVRKGQKVLEIYSPELVTAQRELLYLLESDKDNSRLIQGARQRLGLLGVSAAQIDQLISTRKEFYSFPVYSPVDGYIVEEASVNNGNVASAPPVSATMGNGMSASGAVASGETAALPSEIGIREGMYVRTGERIFKIVDPANVWAEFNQYQGDARGIGVKDSIEIAFDNTNDVVVKAQVNFIQPFFKNGENFVNLRVYLSNPKGKYTIGQLVTGRFFTRAADHANWIPVTSVLDLGDEHIVFVKRRGVFRPRVIEQGRKSEEWIEVLSGIDVNDSIAYQAQYMVDSESFIKVSKRN